MTILLVGEYSKLHNSLQAGLKMLGHDVTLISSGDGFKKFSSDYSFDAKWSENRILNYFRQVLFRLLNFDFAELERGIRFHLLLQKIKNYDVVQIINEQPIKTIPSYELYLIKKVLKKSKKCFLLSCGVDYINLQFLFYGNLRYSILTPYLSNSNNRKHYKHILIYKSENSRKIHDFLYKNVSGIIASDIDYLFALKNHRKFLGLIPNPINVDELVYESPLLITKIIIFLGINEWTYTQKGIVIFEEALKIIEQKFADKVEIIVTRSVPYAQYIKSYNRAHILLDQVYAYDQGYNALEAMAQGKVVFTGAETEFMDYYNLKERVAVNALPDPEDIAREIEFLIHNPAEIIAIGKRARDFVVKEHNYIKVANMYLEVWNKKSDE